MQTIIVALAALAFSIYRQMRPTPVVADKALLLPAVLIVLGVVQGGLTEGGSVALLTLELAAAVVSGVVRGATMRLWRDASGALWRQGTIWTAVAWILSIAIRIGLVLLSHPAGAHAVSTASILIFLGLSLATQTAWVAYRSASISGRVKVQV
ncbi:hypothetical protein J5X84_34820 [Streptosporangiaceae bacterium NEAU-GS5]|nr:hypothetical protein [Streptosporangiaceae bacterium NEAU-GS5]